MILRQQYFPFFSRTLSAEGFYKFRINFRILQYKHRHLIFFNVYYKLIFSICNRHRNTILSSLSTTSDFTEPRI